MTRTQKRALKVALENELGRGLTKQEDRNLSLWANKSDLRSALIAVSVKGAELIEMIGEVCDRMSENKKKEKR